MLLHDPLQNYTAASPEIDSGHPLLVDLVERQGWRDLPDVERGRTIFEFVRDTVHHSWDVQDDRVTCRASDVLAEGVSLCYGKSHLLAALYRAADLPAGLCYQRLVLFEDPADGYSLHGLNAVYLPSLDRWVRVDARGNKPGVAAEFDLDMERLAFAVRPELDEIDYPGVYAEPSRHVVATLRAAPNATTLYRTGLPDHL